MTYQPLNIVPGGFFTATDQYIVVDPTAPNHIHLRGGGVLDNSSAEVYLGGENNYFMTYDPTGSVTISAQTSVYFKGAQPLVHGSSTNYPVTYLTFGADGIIDGGTASFATAGLEFFGALKCIIHAKDTMDGSTSVFEYLVTIDKFGNIDDLSYVGVDSGAGQLVSAATTLEGEGAVITLNLTNIAVSNNPVGVRVQVIALARIPNAPD